MNEYQKHKIELARGICIVCNEEDHGLPEEEDGIKDVEFQKVINAAHERHKDNAYFKQVYPYSESEILKREDGTEYFTARYISRKSIFSFMQKHFNCAGIGVDKMITWDEYNERIDNEVALRERISA